MLSAIRQETHFSSDRGGAPVWSALHAHVIPRYPDEPQALRTMHPWARHWQSVPQFDPLACPDLMQGLRRELGVTSAG